MSCEERRVSTKKPTMLVTMSADLPPPTASPSNTHIQGWTPQERYRGTFNFCTTFGPCVTKLSRHFVHSASNETFVNNFRESLVYAYYPPPLHTPCVRMSVCTCMHGLRPMHMHEFELRGTLKPYSERASGMVGWKPSIIVSARHSGDNPQKLRMRCSSATALPRGGISSRTW